jgi:hypothetical protein
MGSFSTLWKCDASHLGWYSCIFLGSINKNKNPLVWFVHGHDSHCCHCQRPLSRQSWAQKSRLSSLGLTRLHSPSSSRGVLFHGVNDVNDDALSRKNLHVPKTESSGLTRTTRYTPGFSHGQQPQRTAASPLHVWEVPYPISKEITLSQATPWFKSFND